MSGVILGLVTAFVADPVFADLKPEEVAVIAVRSSRESRELAAYYMQAREIPESHLCLIDVEPGKSLSRDEWEISVRPAIRRWISENNLQQTLRCLVTTWDVPLKIGVRESERPDVAQRRVYLDSERTARVDRLMKLIAEIDRLVPGNILRGRAVFEEDVSIDKLAGELDAAFKAAGHRILQQKDTATGKRAVSELGQQLLSAAGVRAMIQHLAKQRPSDQDAEQALARRIELLKGRLVGLREGQAALENLPEGVARDQEILGLLEKSHGILGSIKWIDEQRKLLEKNESYSSFDSELSLLYWPPYPLIRWQPNVLHHRFDDSYVRWLKTTLMVARLEAPTFERTKALIDSAIAVEQQGLGGRVYLDARGIRAPTDKPPDRGSTAEYDEALRHLARIMTDRTDRTVVLNNQKELFQPGECPDAALYCGWYSLARYVDAFEWNRGAVGYHIASSEASTLRKPESDVWCKRMLEEGVCATLGPVYEPYLAAFPRPDEFFVVLMSGRYSLAETYYRTKPFNSWVMVLVGDPLYNPFRAAPVIRAEDLPADMKPLVEHPPSAD